MIREHTYSRGKSARNMFTSDGDIESHGSGSVTICMEPDSMFSELSE
jgi:hypothetical protein